jgi:hypothetical protein
VSTTEASVTVRYGTVKSATEPYQRHREPPEQGRYGLTPGLYGVPVAPTVADPTATWSWRVRNSAWLLIPLLTLGCFSGAGLVVIGIRARRRSWWLPGAGYLLTLCIASIVGSDVGIRIYLGLWCVAIAHCVTVNSDWLQWRAEQERYQNSAPAEPATGPSMALNVNTAGPQQFAALPGFDPARAARVVAERHARQGFGSVKEFADAAGLSHDELRRLQYWLAV